MFNTLDFSIPPIKNASFTSMPQVLIVLMTRLCEGALRAVTIDIFKTDLYKGSFVRWSISIF